jgi:hypothetical protein
VRLLKILLRKRLIGEVKNSVLSKRKEAMPHLQDRNHKAFDLYFELLSPEDRNAIFRDLRQGRTIHLPNFGVVKGRSISNILKSIEWSDLDASSIAYMTRTLNLPTKNQMLTYDSKTYTYKLRS